MNRAAMTQERGIRNLFPACSVSLRWLVFSSLFFGLLTTLSLHVVFADRGDVAEGQTIFGTVDQNAFLPFTSADLVRVAAFSLIAAALFLLASLWINHRPKEQTDVVWDWRCSLCAFTLLMLAWLPYLLSWFPGGIYTDATVSILQATGVNPLSNQQPILYTMLWSCCMALSGITGHGLFAAALLMQAVQVVAMAAAVLYGLYWLASHGASRWLCIASFAFFALFPFIPLYVISLWKETLFAISLFFFSLQYADAVIHSMRRHHSAQDDAQPFDRDKPDLPSKMMAPCFNPIGFALSALGTAFLRNNGIYIIALSLCALLLLNRRQLCTAFREVIAPLLVAVALSFAIQTGVFSLLNLNSSSTVESLGIPLQQVARTYALGGQISEGVADCFEQILPREGWEYAYRPFIVDTIKWHSDFDSSALRANLPSFLMSYLETAVKNPRIYAEGFLLANCGFWNPWIGCNENVAHISLRMWGIDVQQFDLIQQWTGISIRGTLSPKLFPSAAVFVWTVLFVGLLLMANGKRRLAVALVPPLTLWLTLMIATPIAYSLRYAFALVLLAPIVISLPHLVHPYNRQGIK